jgi:hypothetical protein
LDSVILREQTAPFAQLGFGKMPPAELLLFTTVVPPNVTFPSSVKLAIDENDKQPLEVRFSEPPSSTLGLAKFGSRGHLAITRNDNQNSLLVRDNTLFPQNTSLLVVVGNYL